MLAVEQRGAGDRALREVEGVGLQGERAGRLGLWAPAHTLSTRRA